MRPKRRRLSWCRRILDLISSCAATMLLRPSNWTECKYTPECSPTFNRPLITHLYKWGSNILKFADDAKIFKKVRCRSGCSQLQADLDKLVLWAHKWQMVFKRAQMRLAAGLHPDLLGDLERFVRPSSAQTRYCACWRFCERWTVGRSIWYVHRRRPLLLPFCWWVVQRTDMVILTNLLTCTGTTNWQASALNVRIHVRMWFPTAETLFINF